MKSFNFFQGGGDKKTGCYNLYCPGFIQLSKSVTPGMILPTGKSVLKLTIYRVTQFLNFLTNFCMFFIYHIN